MARRHDDVAQPDKPSAEAIAVVQILEILDRFPWESRSRILTEVLRWGGRIPAARMNGPRVKPRTAVTA